MFIVNERRLFRSVSCKMANSKGNQDQQNADISGSRPICAVPIPQVRLMKTRRDGDTSTFTLRWATTSYPTSEIVSFDLFSYKETHAGTLVWSQLENIARRTDR